MSARTPATDTATRIQAVALELFSTHRVAAVDAACATLGLPVEPA